MNFRATLLFLLLSSTGFAQDSLQLSFDPLMNKISSNQIPYKTLSARAKMVWSNGETEQEFTATIRVKKDSLIWMSLGMMGFEGARALVTPDSFQLHNKLANEYEVRDISFLQNRLLFLVSFRMLQEIIAGQKISIDEKASTAGKEDSSTVLYLESDKLLEKIWVDTPHYTINKILLKDKLLKQDMTITFEAYNYSETKPFSYKRNILVNRDASTLKLSMEFTKVNFDGELTYPFEVNEKYKRVE